MKLTLTCEDARELITGLVDNELLPAERLGVESHLRDCQRCRLAYRHEAALKKEIWAAGAILKPPADLQQRILSGRRNAPRGREFLGGLRDLFRPIRLRPAFIIASLILMILPLFYLYRNAASSVPLAALQTHKRIVEGKIPIVRAQTPGEIRERLFQSVQGKFAPMGYDLSMANLRAVGGTVQTIYGHEVLVTIYEGDIPSVTCYTFLGSERDVPSTAGAFFDSEKQVNFYGFSEEGVSAVLHQEGDLICILVSNMPLEDLLELARNKARPS